MRRGFFYCGREALEREPVLCGSGWEAAAAGAR